MKCRHSKRFQTILQVFTRISAQYQIPPALEGELVNNKSWLVTSPWQSKAIKENKDIACVHCGSIDVKKNGRNGGRFTYQKSDSS